MTDIQVVVAVLGALLFTTSVFVAKRVSDKKKSQKVLAKKTTEVADVAPDTIPETEPIPEPRAETTAESVIPSAKPLEKQSLEVPVTESEDSESSNKLSKEPVSLEKALSNTRSGMMGRIKGLFAKTGSLSPDEFDELEEILYTSDLGPKTVQQLMDGMNERLTVKEKSDFTAVRTALKDEMLSIFSEVPETAGFLETTDKKVLVLMIVGVNGAGKTTTIGKLANQFSNQGKKVLVAAGDTFRAAAEGQLKVWSERANVDIFAPEGVKDPSAIAFDACKIAASKEYDVLIVDTAGRLHTQKNLMEELKKMKRVVEKNFPDSPDEVLLVLDANSGQNALIQAKNFHEALNVTGVVLTKLDGSAKGGVAVGVSCELELPVKLIGVGEGIDDLRRFSANEFVESIL